MSRASGALQEIQHHSARTTREGHMQHEVHQQQWAHLRVDPVLPQRRKWVKVSQVSTEGNAEQILVKDLHFIKNEKGKQATKRREGNFMNKKKMLIGDLLFIIPPTVRLQDLTHVWP